jgi:hypothetical protein
MDKRGPDARVLWRGLLHLAGGSVIYDFGPPQSQITPRCFRSRYDGRRTGVQRAKGRVGNPGETDRKGRA